jgi:triosephosphate isomerase
MRNKIVAGNWKMNGNHAESLSLFNAIVAGKDHFPEGVEVMIAPSFLFLGELVKKNEKKIKVIAQNCASKEKGAFTGEVSAAMLQSIGIEGAIVGHSERRLIYGESIADISEKVALLLKYNMQVIFCVGEQLSERKSNSHFSVIEEQLQSIYSIAPLLFKNIVVAYEPVWAIGTGETASPAQAQEMHAFIRTKLKEAYGDQSDETRILYGGSVKADNALELFSQHDVDGGLVGGAALQASDFLEIIKAAG